MIVTVAKAESKEIVIDAPGKWMVELTGENARATIVGALFEPGEYHITVRHCASKTISSQTIRGIVSGEDHIRVLTRVVVDPGISDIDSTQQVRGLVLNESSRFDAQPELEIHSDAVSCAHGVSVGPLDADQMQYLQSRGLTTAQSREILLRAFFADISSYGSISSQVQERISDLLRQQSELS